MKNKKISFILTVVIMAVFVWYFFANREDFSHLLQLNPLFIALTLFGHMAVLITNGFFIKLVVRSFGKDIRFSDSFYAAFITAVGNFFLPVGSGTGAQAVYLKRIHGLSYKNFIAAISGNYIIVFLINASVGIISLWLLASGLNSSESVTLFITFLLIMIVTIVLSIVGIPRPILSLLAKVRIEVVKKILNLFTEILQGWNLIVHNRRLMLSLMLITCINFLSLVLISYTSIKAIGADISMTALILYSALGSVSLLVNITPGSLGIREGIYIYTSSLLGLTTPQILLAAVIDRGVKFFVLFCGWILLQFKPKQQN